MLLIATPRHAAMAQHRHDGDLQKRGMAALFNLAGHTKGAPGPGVWVGVRLGVGVGAWVRMWVWV